MLEAIVANPQQQIRELPLLSEQERHQLLVQWNDTQIHYPAHKCIHSLFEEQVQRTPDAIALVFEDQQLTYWELNARANQLAHYLQSLGVGPEVLVGICVERCVSMVVGLLGILKAGGAYVPLDSTYPAEHPAGSMRQKRKGREFHRSQGRQTYISPCRVASMEWMPQAIQVRSVPLGLASCDPRKYF